MSEGHGDQCILARTGDGGSVYPPRSYLTEAHGTHSSSLHALDAGAAHDRSASTAFEVLPFFFNSTPADSACPFTVTFGQ